MPSLSLPLMRIWHLMETRIERALQNRWVASLAAIAAGYIGLRVMIYVVSGAYYDYYFYPHEKGSEYNYPEIRYTCGQAAILLWSIVRVCTAVLAGRCALFRVGEKWAARFVIAMAFGFVLLLMGLLAGMAARDFGI